MENLKGQIEKMLGFKVEKVKEVKGNLEQDTFKSNEEITIERILKENKEEIEVAGYYVTTTNGSEFLGYFQKQITNKELMNEINNIEGCDDWVRCNLKHVFWLSSKAQRFYREKIYNPKHAFFNVGKYELERLLEELKNSLNCFRYLKKPVVKDCSTTG